MAKHSKTADLLKVLGQKAPTAEAAAASETFPKAAPQPRVKARIAKKSTPKPEHTRKAPAPTRGKAVQVYLHAEDEKIIRELAVWLAPHRKRINDSLVIKTALRAAKTGHEFLAAYDAAVQVDGRSRRSKGQSHHTT